MSPSASPSAPRIGVMLTELAESRATGALRVGRAGTIYLSEGRVTYADSTTTPGPEQILTASGRSTAAAVRRARQSAGEGGEGARLLVSQGACTLGELQFCVLGATLDAAFFLLSASAARPRFRDGDRHWLGAQWYFDVAGLIRECARRRTRLDSVCPSAALDTEPVIPVPRITGQRVVLTAAQWEVLVHADATATPLELARRLGRPAYATLLAVRQLAAQGLLRTPDAPDPPDAPRAADPAPAPARTSAAPSAAPSAETTPMTMPLSAPTMADVDAEGGPPPPLPRRPAHRGSGPRPSGGTASRTEFPQINGDPTDVELLTRLRDALERLL